MDVPLERIDCANCHILFWLTVDHTARLRTTKTGFKCPSGHNLSFDGPNEADKLRQRVADLESQKKYAEERAASNANWARREERRRAALRGVVTRMRRNR
jgi:hypothetical protein